MSNTKRPRNPELSREHAPRSTVFIVALVVILCIGAVVGISVWLKHGSGSDDTAAAPVTQSANTSAGALNCTTAPSPPASAKQFDKAPDPSTAEDATWTATVKTNCGDITMSLDGKAAPQTVASFLYLSQQGYYDDSPCHRLTTSGLFVLQCGDPTGLGNGTPGYSYGIENAPKDGDYPRGTLAMARTDDPNSNGSQFFIVYEDTQLPTDGGGYSIFGTVTGGMDIVDAIAKQGVQGGGTDGKPAQPISIESISVAKA